MKPGIIYRGTIKDNQFTTDNELDPQTWLVHILDHGNLIDDSSSEEFIEMVMAGEPIKPNTKNNDEDKFSPILTTIVELLVHTDSQVNINTFAGGDDNRWEVKVWLNNQIWFNGFLKLDDIQQDFMPDPNELLLTASDNLDILRDIPLTDDNGDTLRGYNKIITYIANALKKTGLSLEIKVINNIREQDTVPFLASDATFVTGPNQIGTFEGPSYFAAGKKIKVSGSTLNDGIYTITSIISSTPTITLNIAETLTTEIATNITFNDAEGHFYDHEYLEARTFEGNEVGVSHDSFSALEKILGEHCRLFQHWGFWWIVSTDELDDNDLRIFTFDTDGVFDINSEEVTTYEKEIGIDKSIFFINEDAVVKATRPHKYIKETFALNPPLETICNIDFSRGDFIAEGIGYRTYVLDDWTVVKDFPTGGTPASTAFIRRDFNDLDLEEVRYAVITPESGSSESGIQSCAIPVGLGDVFDLSFDWRFSSNVSDTGPYTRRVAIARIVGDDGTYWTLDDDKIWYQSNVTWTVNLKILQQTIDTAEDEREVQSYSIRCNKIPVNGDMYIHLLSESDSRYNVDIYFSNLSLDYHFYIGDAYRGVTSQYHKITSVVTNNKIKREHDVFISDSPRRIFKGSLTKFDGDAYVLTELFYKYNIYFDTVPPSDQFKTFGEWQAWWIWNQFRLANREFDFTAQGLDSNSLITTTPNPISPLHKYFLTDTNESTAGRHFMLLHHEADVYLGEWSGFISEVFNEKEGKDYGSGQLAPVDAFGEWYEMIYNTGGGDVTVYYIHITGIVPSGFYKETTPTVPPFTPTIDLADYTYLGSIGDIVTDLGITYPDIVDFSLTGDTSTSSSPAMVITSTHEFKYLFE